MILFSLLYPCSYKRFIPDSLNRTIKQRNFLTRIRINNVFRNFLNEFNSKTIQDSNITLYDLKVKYLSTLETLTQGLGREIINPKSLKVAAESEGSPAHTLPLGDDGLGYEVQVSGTTGISWRRKPVPVSLALKVLWACRFLKYKKMYQQFWILCHGLFQFCNLFCLESFLNRIFWWWKTKPNLKRTRLTTSRRMTKGKTVDGQFSRTFSKSPTSSLRSLVSPFTDKTIKPW